MEGKGVKEQEKNVRSKGRSRRAFSRTWKTEEKNTEQEVRRIRDKKELGGEEVEDIEEEGKGKNKRSRRKKGRLQQ